jgi:hypothetical protein
LNVFSSGCQCCSFSSAPSSDPVVMGIHFPESVDLRSSSQTILRTIVIMNNPPLLIILKTVVRRARPVAARIQRALSLQHVEFH